MKFVDVAGCGLEGCWILELQAALRYAESTTSSLAWRRHRSLGYVFITSVTQESSNIMAKQL
jgi:hypothetical protein